MGIIYSIFGFILRLCYNICANNFIVALILFTLIAKLLMLPMGLSQQKSSAKIKKMQPEMDQIKKKYGANQQKYGEELQKLYQKYDYKMSAGCLPLLIQFPIIIGLFGVIYYPMTYVLNMSAQEVVDKAAGVLGGLTAGTDSYKLVETVANIDPVSYSASGTARGAEIVIAKAADLMDFDLFGVIDLSQTPSLAVFSWLWLIPLFAGLSAMLSGYVSTKLNGQQLSGMTKGMIFGMPIFSVVIAFSLPATIGFYWTVSSILQIGQSFLVKKLYSPEREERRIQARKEKERLEKLDRLRRFHEDDDLPEQGNSAETKPAAQGEKDKGGKNKGGKPAVSAPPAVKDDPDSRMPDRPVGEAAEEKELSRKQKKAEDRRRLRESREGKPKQQ